MKGSRPLGFATISPEAEVNLPLDVQDVLEESCFEVSRRSEKNRPAAGRMLAHCVLPGDRGLVEAEVTTH